MERFGNPLTRGALALLFLPALTLVPPTGALATELAVFHADSLAGPMRELKAAFEARHPGVTLRLTPGVSRQLAERILKGEACDVFAPSSPAVIEEDLMPRRIEGPGQDAAQWYVVFSANEMVVITAKGNPLRIRQIGDLLKSGVRYLRVTGEKDLATGRTIEFLKRASTLEGTPELAQKLVDGAVSDGGTARSVPDTVNAVKQGKADAGIVYYSAAVAARNDVDIVRFPDSVNMSEAIRNAATVPGGARNAAEATAFVAFLLTPDAQKILQETGQPPVVPAIRRGAVPDAIR